MVTMYSKQLLQCNSLGGEDFENRSASVETAKCVLQQNFADKEQVEDRLVCFISFFNTQLIRKEDVSAMCREDSRGQRQTEVNFLDRPRAVASVPIHVISS